MSGGEKLAATVDGAALGDDEARALWTAFSQHMDEHRGDMAGFAASRGWASVAPTFQGGRAVLVAWTTEAAKAAGEKAAQAAQRRGAKGNGKGRKQRRRR